MMMLLKPSFANVLSILLMGVAVSADLSPFNLERVTVRVDGVPVPMQMELTVIESDCVTNDTATVEGTYDDANHGRLSLSATLTVLPVSGSVPGYDFALGQGAFTNVYGSKHDMSGRRIAFECQQAGTFA